MAKKLFKWVENTEGKGEILRAISPFPSVFSKEVYSRHVKAALVWERVRVVDIILLVQHGIKFLDS